MLFKYHHHLFEGSVDINEQREEKGLGSSSMYSTPESISWIKGSFQCLVLVQPMMLTHLTVLVYEIIECQVMNAFARKLLLKFCSQSMF